MKQQSKSEVYFERQSFFSLQCGRHSVNNILGDSVYTKDSMTQICFELSDDFINPHKHLFGGDYDVNVLMLALQRHQFSTKWHDRRDGDIKVPALGEGHEVMGYLVNIYAGGGPSFMLKLCGLSRRHWFAVRRVKDTYYWMDSKNQAPVARTSSQTQIELRRLLKQGADSDENTEVIVVLRE